MPGAASYQTPVASRAGPEGLANHRLKLGKHVFVRAFYAARGFAFFLRPSKGAVMNFGPKMTGRGIGRMLVGLGALMSLAMIPASAVTNLTGEYTFTTNTDPYGILVLNNNTASGSYGIQANSYAPQGAGVYGYSDASGLPGYGLAGISQNGYGVYGSSYGSGITAIYGEDLNAGGGIGIAGVSNGGNGAYGEGAQNGVVGQTNSASTGANYAGVYGIDASSGAGVVGYGVYGQTANNTGVNGLATGTGYGVIGTSDSGPFAVFGQANGIAVGAEGYSGVGGSAGSPSLAAAEGAVGTDLFATYGYYDAGSGNTFPENFTIQAGTADNSGNTLMPGASDVQISGDVYVDGAVYTGCSTFPETNPGADCDEETDVARSAAGVKVRTYAPQQSMKTLEDFGEGQLANGQGYVALDRTFASTIARDTPYLVFITPEGDSNGLYVTGRSLSGFAVRESKGGHSAIGFTYRIVAHPIGASAVRMAAIGARPVHTLASNPRMRSRWLKHMMRPASIGSRITRRPQVWVKNMHRSI
jgi:hypothetical protein